MKSLQLSMKKRFLLNLAIILLLAIALFTTALNQLKKVKEYSALVDETTLLQNASTSIDSLQSILLTTLPRNINFFRTSKNSNIDYLIDFNNNLIYRTNRLSENFYLNKNPKIRLKAFQIKRELKNYNDLIQSFTKYLNQKGLDGYGLNGQLNLVIQNLSETCKQENIPNLLQKISIISDYKNRYLLERDPLIINKIKIESEEAKAYAILSGKTQRLQLLTKLQQIDELIIKLNEIDIIIGITSNDGILGRLNATKKQYFINAAEIGALARDEMDKAIFRGYLWLSFVFVMLALSLLAFIRHLDKNIIRPISKMKKFIAELVVGKFPDPLQFRRKDEIADMGSQLNSVVDGLKAKAEFAIEIGKGKLDSTYVPLSEDDILGNALINMEKSLQKADMEDQKYKDEELKRIWANEGLAKFNEILRLHNNDIGQLSDEIIQNLVTYLNVALGGLYFLNNEQTDNQYLEMVAAFAYDRKKHVKANIGLGEGLVGACAVEKQLIYITDIPEDYVTVISGLGDAKPKCLLLVPLKLEDELLGVVELASFVEFKPHQIEFVEKIGQTIASTIISVKINARTAKLLEQSQKQAEEMAEQEEEMRQNMEELRTTQEDFSRRESELSGFLEAVQNSTMLLVFDDSRKIIDANTLILDVLQVKHEDLVGRYHREFTSINKNTEELEHFWDELSKGKTKKIIEKIRRTDGKDIFLSQSFSPVLDKKGKLIKVVCLSTDITENKEYELSVSQKENEIKKITRDIESLNNAIDESIVRCEYTPEGRISYVNDNYCRLTGHARSELLGKVSTIYLKEDEKQLFDKIWNEIIKDKPYTGVIKRSKPTGEEVWLIASFVTVKNEEGNIVKIYFLAQDITERRLKYQLLEEANKEIERLKKEKE